MGLYQDRENLEAPEHFYPAFGGASNKKIKGLIINEGGQLKTVDDTRWYECREQDGELVLITPALHLMLAT